MIYFTKINGGELKISFYLRRILRSNLSTIFKFFLDKACISQPSNLTSRSTLNLRAESFANHHPRPSISSLKFRSSFHQISLPKSINLKSFPVLFTNFPMIPFPPYPSVSSAPQEGEESQTRLESSHKLKRGNQRGGDGAEIQ